MLDESGLTGPRPQDVRRVVQERLGVEVPDTATDLIDEGLLDSLALVTLIVGLEDAYGCSLPLDDFDLEHFRTVDAMTAFLTESQALVPSRPEPAA